MIITLRHMTKEEAFTPGWYLSNSTTQEQQDMFEHLISHLDTQWTGCTRQVAMLVNVAKIHNTLVVKEV